MYDNVQQRAELGVAQRQLSTVRDALLRFRVDMGYFPGEGPLAATALNLDNLYFVDGTAPETATPVATVRQRWAAHPLNLWMLYEKPVDADVLKPTRWDWNASIQRGWRGPYLGQGFGFKLDMAGDAAGFQTSEDSKMFNRLYAVPDLIGRGSATATTLAWTMEDRPVTVNAQPTKTRQSTGGRPIAFLADRDSTLGWVIFRVVSPGLDGIFQTMTVPAGDDITMEVARHKTTP